MKRPLDNVDRKQLLTAAQVVGAGFYHSSFWEEVSKELDDERKGKFKTPVVEPRSLTNARK